MIRRTGESSRRLPTRRAGKTVRLRPANPFDLIRLIAHSQSDPRKALAELVQNSLDAQAKHVTVTRWRRRGEMAISILDDGRGVFPELERPEALEQIATNIGHSFKRNLSAAERQREMMLGKYGIGILGFWSVGRELEMRTRVGGSEVWCLRLVRDEADADAISLPQRRIEFPGETWTEVVIRGVHEGATRQIAGRRLGDYLGSELRGQLLERPVKLQMVDRVARGTAPKDFLVVPQRYRGRRIHDIFQVAVLGHPPARLELYFVEEEERERSTAVALTCGGSVACEDISQLEGCDFARAPWTSGCLEGFIEFPALEVTPATRRGIVPGPASEALFEALRSIEPKLIEVIDKEKEKRRAEEDDGVVRELRKVSRRWRGRCRSTTSSRSPPGRARVRARPLRKTCDSAIRAPAGRKRPRRSPRRSSRKATRLSPSRRFFRPGPLRASASCRGRPGSCPARRACSLRRPRTAPGGASWKASISTGHCATARESLKRSATEPFSRRPRRLELRGSLSRRGSGSRTWKPMP